MRCNDSNDIVKYLNDFLKNNVLIIFISKLSDFIIYLPPDNYEIFWETFIICLNKPDNSLFKTNSFEDIAYSFSSLVSKMENFTEQEARVKQIFSIMITNNDLIIIQRVMRRYLFGYGLAKLNERPRFDKEVLLSKEYIKSLMESEAERYRKAICDSLWLAKNSPEGVFII